MDPTSSPDWRSPEAIQKWWYTPSQRDIKRDYPPSTVIALRDGLFEAHNRPANKLRGIFARHQQCKSVHLVPSVIEPVSLQMISEVGFETAYVSGGMASMTDTATNDPTTDLSDYTYDTVPNKVASLYRSQLLHYRTAMARGDTDRAEASIVPLIADGDSGAGLHTTVMKLTKLFVQSGVAGFHLDDLLSGAKRFDGHDGVGYVVVPLSEHVRRLKAAKLQLDVMGAETVLIHRTDAMSATHITSTIDPRDTPFILGATVNMPTDLCEVESGPLRAQWKIDAKLATLEEAFASACPDLVATLKTRIAGLNVSRALRVAQELYPDFFWSAESPRTAQGWYAFKGGIDCAISRSLVCAPLVDMTWACVGSYDPKGAAQIAAAVQEAYPGKWMAYNITGGFPDDGSRDDEVKALPESLASLGYVWQFLPIAGLTAVAVGVRSVGLEIKKGGLLGYLQSASRPAGRTGHPSAEWWWKDMARLTDMAADAIGEGL
ncbi:isocitrate lyase 1 [Saitozyma podzolica]|uniref:methylisocitrate lyase n=1 Tax=Saitozyma podzolica TaxID=1890683 RepID=A0A427YCB1_9TREE|nr:isocitrate lyase 1 [Saitozyma podzolica]